MLDDDKWLTSGVYSRSVKRMARHDFDVAGQILLKGGQFGGFTRGLPTDYGTDLGGGAILGDHLINDLGLHTVYDPVASSRNEMSIWQDVYSILFLVNHVLSNLPTTQTSFSNSFWSVRNLSGRSQALTLHDILSAHDLYDTSFQQGARKSVEKSSAEELAGVCESKDIIVVG